jgi:acetyl esterase/lipase
MRVGGGFALGASMDHFVFWGTDVMSFVNAKTPNAISFLFVAYTLTPHATYPEQPREAIEALVYLLEDLKRAPGSISLGGDSSGGNLCLAILSQILHPTPELPTLKLEAPLKTMLLLSPWVSFRMDFPSCNSNAHRDITADKAEILWATTYLAGAASTPYAEPLDADSDWWRGAESVVQHAICTAGTDEIAFDAVKQWSDKYKSATSDGHLEFVLGHREVHIAPVIRLLFMDSKPTEQGEAIKAFLLARL